MILLRCTSLTQQIHWTVQARFDDLVSLDHVPHVMHEDCFLWLWRVIGEDDLDFNNPSAWTEPLTLLFQAQAQAQALTMAELRHRQRTL